MKEMFRAIALYDKAKFAWIVCLTVALSFLGGVGIAMLIPMLSLIESQKALEWGNSALLGWLYELPYIRRMAILIGAYVLIIALRAALGRCLTIAQTKYVEKHNLYLREKLYDAISGADWECLTARRHTEFIDLFVGQTARISYGATEMINLMANLLSAAGKLVVALFMSVPMTIMVVVAGGAMLLFLRPAYRRSRKYGDSMIETSRNFYSEIIGQLSSLKEIRAYGCEADQQMRFEDACRQFESVNVGYARFRTIPQLEMTVVSALLIGIIFIMSQSFIPMDMASLAVLIYIFTKIWPSIASTQRSLQNISSTLPAYEQLRDTLSQLTRQSAPLISGAPLEFKRSIRFCDVSFRYRGTDVDVLKKVSFEIPRGSIAAMSGRSGAGKSTTADIMLGLLRPTGGSVFVDGVEIGNANAGAWRRLIGYVPQDPIIFNASVRENLLRFHSGFTDEELQAALKRAAAWDFVSRLPEGLDTILGDRGVRLSGGERQRIVLARALLGKPRLIVLDEATSSLDAESEAAIKRALFALRGEATVFIIAHRLSTIMSADQILILRDGEIAESGRPEELIGRSDGYLAQMIDMG